jgi:predicted lipid-binding transport protein (Tim44 family)
MNRGFSPGNPIANIFVIVVGALAIGASIVLGFFAFVVLGSIIAVLAAVIGLRVWWFNRKLRSQMKSSAGQDERSPGGTIEGEYRIVADDRDDG